MYLFLPSSKFIRKGRMNLDARSSPLHGVRLVKRLLYVLLKLKGLLVKPQRRPVVLARIIRALGFQGLLEEKPVALIHVPDFTIPGSTYRNSPLQEQVVRSLHLIRDTPVADGSSNIRPHSHGDVHNSAG